MKVATPKLRYVFIDCAPGNYSRLLRYILLAVILYFKHVAIMLLMHIAMSPRTSSCAKVACINGKKILHYFGRSCVHVMRCVPYLRYLKLLLVACLVEIAARHVSQAAHLLTCPKVSCQLIRPKVFCQPSKTETLVPQILD